MKATFRLGVVAYPRDKRLKGVGFKDTVAVADVQVEDLRVLRHFQTGVRRRPVGEHLKIGRARVVFGRERGVGASLAHLNLLVSA